MMAAFKVSVLMFATVLLISPHLLNAQDPTWQNIHTATTLYSSNTFNQKASFAPSGVDFQAVPMYSIKFSFRSDFSAGSNSPILYWGKYGSGTSALEVNFIDGYIRPCAWTGNTYQCVSHQVSLYTTYNIVITCSSTLLKVYVGSYTSAESSPGYTFSYPTNTPDSIVFYSGYQYSTTYISMVYFINAIVDANGNILATLCSSDSAVALNTEPYWNSDYSSFLGGNFRAVVAVPKTYTNPKFTFNSDASCAAVATWSELASGTVINSNSGSKTVTVPSCFKLYTSVIDWVNLQANCGPDGGASSQIALSSKNRFQFSINMTASQTQTLGSSDSSLNSEAGSLTLGVTTYFPIFFDFPTEFTVDNSQVTVSTHGNSAGAVAIETVTIFPSLSDSKQSTMVVKFMTAVTYPYTISAANNLAAFTVTPASNTELKSKEVSTGSKTCSATPGSGCFQYWKMTIGVAVAAPSDFCKFSGEYAVSLSTSCQDGVEGCDASGAKAVAATLTLKTSSFCGVVTTAGLTGAINTYSKNTFADSAKATSFKLGDAVYVNLEASSSNAVIKSCDIKKVIVTGGLSALTLVDDAAVTSDGSVAECAIIAVNPDASTGRYSSARFSCRLRASQIGSISSGSSKTLTLSLTASVTFVSASSVHEEKVMDFKVQRSLISNTPRIFATSSDGEVDAQQSFDVVADVLEENASESAAVSSFHASMMMYIMLLSITIFAFVGM